MKWLFHYSKNLIYFPEVHLQIRLYHYLNLVRSNLFLDTHHVHIAGYYNFGAIKAELPIFLKKVIDSGRSVSLNSQYDATNEWCGIEELARYLTFLICSEAELLLIAKAPDLDEAVGTVLSWGCSTVVVTMGSAGANAYSKTQTITQTSFPVKVSFLIYLQKQIKKK